MTKEQKFFVKYYGEMILEMEKRFSNVVPKLIKCKIVRPGQEPVYVVANHPDDFFLVLTENGFRTVK